MINFLLEIDYQELITSKVGQIVISLVALGLLLLAVGRSSKEQNNRFRVKILTYSALAVAASIALSYVKIMQMPQGGSLTLFSMMFILIIGYFYGVSAGVMVGTVYGLMQLVLGGWVMHPIQLLLDYPVAFGALGLSGIFAGQKHGLAKGILIGSLARFVSHFLSGVIFFSSYAPEGWNPMIYSAWYNFSYVGIEGIATAILVSVPAMKVAFERLKRNATA